MIRRAWVRIALAIYLGAGLLTLVLYTLVAWGWRDRVLAVSLIELALVGLAPVIWFGAIMPLFATFTYRNCPPERRSQVPLIIELLRIRDADSSP